MLLIGLTGGIGMGKSTSAALFEERGVPVVDTDLLARAVVEPGQPALTEVREVFGDTVVGPDGALRRDVVAKMVFADAEKLRRLEAILHPRIRELWRAQAAQWRLEGRPWGVVVIPLLFETGAAAELDSVVCVACSAGTQRARLRARGWTAEQVAQRVAAQWPVQKKMDLAQHVIWTEAGLDVHAAQLDKVIERLRGRGEEAGTRGWGVTSRAR
jgi:dephospho-CoA kinase